MLRKEKETETGGGEWRERDHKFKKKNNSGPNCRLYEKLYHRGQN